MAASPSGITFHVIRHGEATSNLDFQSTQTGFIQGSNRWGFENKPVVTGEHYGVAGCNLFRVVLTPGGIQQCVVARNTRFNFLGRDQITKIYSSPLERCVQTAILTTPFDILERSNFTITLVPQVQEAIKFPCDPCSDDANLIAQVKITREILLGQLKVGGQATAAHYARLKSVKEINIDFSNMSWKYEDLPGVEPRQVLAETHENLLSRAHSARKFFLSEAAKNKAPALIYLHGQIAEYFSGLYTMKVGNCGRFEMQLYSVGDEVKAHVPINQANADAIPGLAQKIEEWKVSAEKCRADTNMRAERSSEPEIADRKKKFIEAMKRTPVQSYVSQAHPDSWKNQREAEASEHGSPLELLPFQQPGVFMTASATTKHFKNPLNRDIIQPDEHTIRIP